MLLASFKYLVRSKHIHGEWIKNTIVSIHLLSNFCTSPFALNNMHLKEKNRKVHRTSFECQGPSEDCGGVEISMTGP